MPRVTLDIDGDVLRELQRRQKTDGRPLGRLASELLTLALAETDESPDEPPAASPPPPPPPSGRWRTQPMGARVDVEDHAAVIAVLEQDQ